MSFSRFTKKITVSIPIIFQMYRDYLSHFGISYIVPSNNLLLYRLKSFCQKKS